MNGITIFSSDTLRLVFTGFSAPVFAAIMPTQKFVLALILVASFNIWAGMRADGVVIFRCKRFSMKKLRGALAELALYVSILWLIHGVMWLCGDGTAAVYATKTLTYVIMYVYVQNAFKNLVIAYPKNKGLWVIYLVIRLELKRLLPGHISELVDRYDKKHKGENAEE